MIFHIDYYLEIPKYSWCLFTFWVSSYRRSYKMSVRHFFLDWVISFFWFLHNCWKLEFIKTDRAWKKVPVKFIFTHNFGKKGPPILDLLKNFVISFSWKWSKMKTNIVTDISPPIPYLAKFWVSSYGSKCCWPIKLQGSLKCNISRKKESVFLACR